MRVRFKVVAIFESAGFSLVDVDRHQPGRGLPPQDAPLSAGGEAGAAQAAQLGGLKSGDDLVPVAVASQAVGEQGVAALFAVLGVTDAFWQGAGCLPRRYGGDDLVLVRLFQRAGAHHRHRRGVATAYAWRGLHPHLLARGGGSQRGAELPRPEHLAGEGLAHPHRQRRRRGFVALQHIEMMVESGRFIDFGHGQLHFNRQGQQVAVGQATVAVLELVQVFHQQVAVAGFIPQQLADVGQRLVGRNPPLNTTSLAACAFHWPVKKWQGKQAPPGGSSFTAWQLV